jgi:hypothetical protein
MLSLIFLDFDGVLNCVGTKDRINHPKFSGIRIRGLDKERVELVSSLAEETNSQIIISSSWREVFDMAQIKSLLKSYGFVNSVRIIDRTPIQIDSGWSLSKMTLTRSDEIELYLKNNQPDHLLILDDIVTKYKRYQIQTVDSTGFFSGHMKRARQILSLKFEPENLG